MTINLYPYNIYILYAALAALFVSFLVLASHAVKLLMTLKQLAPALLVTKQQSEILETKGAQVKQIADNNLKTVKNAIAGIVILDLLKAAMKIMKENEDQSRFSQIVQSAASFPASELTLLRKLLG